MAKSDLPFWGLEQMEEVYEVEYDMLFERLLSKLNAQRHLFLVAERSWGLKDYVNELGFQLREKHQDIQICRIDLKPAHSSGDFMELFERTLSNRFPEATFKIEATEIKAREYCNLHGLWQG